MTVKIAVTKSESTSTCHKTPNIENKPKITKASCNRAIIALAPNFQDEYGLGICLKDQAIYKTITKEATPTAKMAFWVSSRPIRGPTVSNLFSVASPTNFKYFIFWSLLNSLSLNKYILSLEDCIDDNSNFSSLANSSSFDF